MSQRSASGLSPKSGSIGNLRLARHLAKHGPALAAAAALWTAASATVGHAGVTVTTSNGSFSAFPGTPMVATNGSWNMLNFTLVGENTDSTQPGQARMIAQTFTATQTFTLTQISILSTGGPGDGGANPNTIHLYDLNSTHSLPGSYNLTTDTNPAPAVDMFSGNGAGLQTFFPGFGDKRFINFAFTGTNGNDASITIQAGHLYTFELWGTEGFLTYTFWNRVSGADASGGNPYADGNGFNAPTSNFATSGGTFSGLRTQLAGNPRDLLMAVYGNVVGPTNAQWNVDADGNWSVASNWTPSAPNAAGAVATFGPIIMAPRTVTVDSAQTTGQVNFNNANKYTIAGGSALTLDNTSGGVGVTVTAGSHDISAPLVLAKDATMTVTPAGSTLKITNLQTSTVNITIGGAGTSAFNTVRANSLTVNSGVAAIIPGRSSNSTSKITSLTIAGGAAPTARLDMGDNDLAVDYSGSSPLSTIAAQIKSGYNSGAWNGNGISSVAAAATASSAHSTALGYGESSAVLGPSGGTFSGQNVDGTAVLVRYTYSGDANLDGSVDTVDFNLLAASFSQSNKSWSNGDFNYDGSVDTVDFNLLASNFAQPTIAAPALVGGLVPEPASMTTLGWALGALLLTRRRRARC